MTESEKEPDAPSEEGAASREGAPAGGGAAAESADSTATAGGATPSTPAGPSTAAAPAAGAGDASAGDVTLELPAAAGGVEASADAPATGAPSGAASAGAPPTAAGPTDAPPAEAAPAEAGATDGVSAESAPAVTPPADAAPVVGGDPLRTDRIRLVGASGHSMSVGVRTPLGKHMVRQFGEDSNVWDTEQCTLERGPDGAWQVVPQAGTTNETLLNGEPLVEPRPLREGDVIAVGRAGKGIAKLPLTVGAG